MATDAHTENSKNTDKKLVKATELPITGNPYPPKDKIINDTPGFLETKVRDIRIAMRPILDPIASAYTKTSDVFSIGAAHTRSTIEMITDSPGSATKTLVISGTGLAGVILARRGLIRRVLYASFFGGVAAAMCYPEEAKENGRIALYIARNKLPSFVKVQYDRLTNSITSADTSPQADSSKES